MATYAIGDLQGCYDAFVCLLKTIRFNPDRDQLWLAGDLINRGPDSLKTLQHCFDLRENLVSVLGNHDLHLLAVASGAARLRRKDSFQDILSAPNQESLLEWLLTCPLLHENDRWVICHAGIYPLWDLDTARANAREVESVLKGKPKKRLNFFNNMYGNAPANWQPDLTGTDRWRTITNFFTRMRMLEANGDIELTYKDSAEQAPDHLLPWFLWHGRTPIQKNILFGHWAALENPHPANGIFALDSGCVWGNRLSAFCLETEQWAYCSC